MQNIEKESIQGIVENGSDGSISAREKSMKKEPPTPLAAVDQPRFVMLSISQEKLDRFIEAFSTNTAGSVRTCECGKPYYNSDGGWDWDDGELEALESEFPENDRDYSIGTVVLGGKSYSNACDCWHEKAEGVIKWLDHHDHQIANYINGERKNALMDAKAMPEVFEHNVKVHTPLPASAGVVLGDLAAMVGSASYL